MWFLLCALVQVASVHEPQDQDGAPHLLLCAFVQVASKSPPDRRNSLRASALRTCASCFSRQPLRLFQTLYFCSAHLCKLLPFQTQYDYLGCTLLLCALVQVASMTTPELIKLMALLLCALVQVASSYKSYSLREADFCSAHLCKLLQYTAKRY